MQTLALKDGPKYAVPIVSDEFPQSFWLYAGRPLRSKLREDAGSSAPFGFF